MTITITKAKLALAVLAVALVVPATAWASGVFDDVPDGRFFTEAAEWAAAEGITTGVSTDPPLFAPDDPVTRGQNVTFLKRYHDNIVVPADTALREDIDANADAIADLPTVHAVRVDFDGTLLKGPAGTTSSNTGTGYYQVDFPVAVSDCVWQATPTNGTGLFLIDTDQVFVALQQGFSGLTTIEERIVVRMKDEDGNAQNNRFDLVVHC